MNLVSIRIITADISRLVTFYEQVTGITATWATTDFAELVTSSGTLAIGSTRTLALFGGEIAHPAANRSAIIEFLVDDVDAAYAAMPAGAEVVAEPTTMPWGNRSLLVRDPDGNLVNLFAPVSPEAIAKWRRHSRAAAPTA